MGVEAPINSITDEVHILSSIGASCCVENLFIVYKMHSFIQPCDFSDVMSDCELELGV